MVVRRVEMISRLQYRVDSDIEVRTVGMDSGMDGTRIGQVIQLMVRDRISIVVRGRLSSFSSSLDSGRIVKGDRVVIQRMGVTLI